MKFLMLSDLVSVYVKLNYPKQKILVIYLETIDDSYKFVCENFPEHDKAEFVFQDVLFVEFNKDNEDNLMRLWKAYCADYPFMQIYIDGEWIDENT